MRFEVHDAVLAQSDLDGDSGENGDHDIDNEGGGDDDDDDTSAEHISLFIRSFALSEVSTSVGKSKQF